MELIEFLAEIHKIWTEHKGAVLFMDDAPILRFDRDELDDEKMMIVLGEFIKKGHEYWFDYYD